MDLTTYLDPNTIHKLQTGGYVLMLALMIFEGPIVTFIASFLASLGLFSFPIVLALGWTGDILGDLLYFCIGRYGMKIFKKIQKKQDASKYSDYLAGLERLVKSNLFLSIFVIKFTPYIQPLGLTFIGKLNTPVRMYALYSIILCIPIPFVFGMAGYNLGRLNALLQTHSKEDTLLALIGAITIILISTAIIIYLLKTSKKVLEKAEKE